MLVSQRAAAAGDVHALREAASLLKRTGRYGEAMEWYQRAAEAELDALRRFNGSLDFGRVTDLMVQR